jgi:hypothetical protein
MAQIHPSESTSHMQSKPTAPATEDRKHSSARDVSQASAPIDEDRIYYDTDTDIPPLEIDENNPCTNQFTAGHAQYTCTTCREALNASFDNLLHENMLREGWTEAQIRAEEPLRHFATKPLEELIPDLTQPAQAQRRAWAENCVRELQARIDQTRAIHEARGEK